jgi:thiol-disulfide isomerase/thioredoxin
MKISSFVGLLILFLTQSCASKYLSGRITLDEKVYDPMVYLIDPSSFNGVATSYVGVLIDSAKIKMDGSFSFNNPMVNDTEKLYFLAIQKKGERYKNRLDNDQPNLANYHPIILKGGENLQLEFDASNIPSSIKIVQGSKTNEDLVKLSQYRVQLFNKYKTSITGADHDEENLLENEKNLLTYQLDLVKESKKYNHFLIEILALRWASIEGNYERIPELVKDFHQRWNGKELSPLWMQQVKALIAKLPLSIGDPFPDFDLPMANGQVIPLKKQLSSSLTLIDMWASWCAPCRKENKETLVPIWDKYHNDGFQIIGYALDSDDNAWKKAIEKDGASRWPHASHLKGDESPFFEKLKISSIPANYLLDEKGIIVAKNLHGEELERFVAGYFKR